MEHISLCRILLSCRARYGVQLEKGPFEKRTADFLWMMIFGAITLLVSVCFCKSFILMLVYSTRKSWSIYLTLFTLLSGIICYTTTLVSFLRNIYGFHASLCLEQRVSKCTNKHIWPGQPEGILFNLFRHQFFFFFFFFTHQHMV